MLGCRAAPPLGSTYLMTEAESEVLDKAIRQGFLVMPSKPCFP